MMIDAARVLLRITEHATGPNPGPFFLAGLSASPSLAQKCGIVLQQVLQRLCPSIDALSAVDDALRNKETNYCFRWLATRLATFAAANDDCGWSTVYISCKLIERVAQEFPAAQCRSDITAARTVREIANDFHQLALWTGELLGRDGVVDESCASMRLGEGSLHRIRDSSGFTSLLVDSMRLGSNPAMGVTHAEEEHVAQLLLDCIVKTSTRAGHLAPSKLRVATMLADRSVNPLLESQVVEGALIDWSLPLEAQVMHLQGTFPSSGVCVVFESDLQWTSEDDAKLFAEVLTPLNVKFVLCQRTIDPRLREMLAESFGCVAVERLSIRYIDVVCNLTGAPLLHSQADLMNRIRSCTTTTTTTTAAAAGACGFVQSLERMRGGTADGRRHLMLLRSRQPIGSSGMVVTLVLRIGMPCMAESLEHKVTHAFRVVCSMLAHGAWAVDGRGQFEGKVIHALRTLSEANRCASSPTRPERLIANWRSISFVEQVVECYREQQLQEEGELSPGARDYAAAKVGAFQTALDVAASALQIQHVIVGDQLRNME